MKFKESAVLVEEFAQESENRARSLASLTKSDLRREFNVAHNELTTATNACIQAFAVEGANFDHEFEY